MRKKKTSALKPYILDEYVVDQRRAGLLYGALLRSDRAFGRVKSIDTTTLPDDYKLYTARDIPKKNGVRTFGVYDEIFCDDFLHYKGQVIGILIGPSLKEVRRLVKRVMIVFDERYITEERNDKILATRTIKTGLFDGTQKWGNDRLLTVDEIFGTADVSDDLYKKSDFVVNDIFSYKEKRPKWAESTGVMCYMDGDVLNVLSATRWPYQLQSTIMAALEIPIDKIVIRKTKSRNNSSGGLTNTTILAAQCAIACYLSGKPVKVMLSQDEEEYFSSGIETKITQHSAVSVTGRISAMQVYADIDAGYDNRFAQEISDRVAIAITSPYYIKNLSIEVKVHSSNRVPCALGIESIDSSAFFGLENHINHIAYVAGVLPQDVRYINKDNFQALFHFPSLDYKSPIDAILKDSDFNRKYTAYKEIGKLGFVSDNKSNNAFRFAQKRGIGISSAFEGTYFFGSKMLSLDQKMEVVLNMDQKVLINSVVPTASCVSLWKSVVSKIMKIDEKNISITTLDGSEDTKFEPSKYPENLVGNVSLMTVLLKKCCQSIQKQRFQKALPIISKKGITSGMKKLWDGDNFCGSPFHSVSYGAAVVECVIDPVTFKVKVVAVYVAIDCGEIFSLKNATNAVRQSVCRELEELTDDAKISYDKITTTFVQSSKAPCQIGSLIHSLIPAAFASAVSIATKKVVKALPVTSDTIFTMVG